MSKCISFVQGCLCVLAVMAVCHDKVLGIIMLPGYRSGRSTFHDVRRLVKQKQMYSGVYMYQSHKLAQYCIDICQNASTMTPNCLSARQANDQNQAGANSFNSDAKTKVVAAGHNPLRVAIGARSLFEKAAKGAPGLSTRRNLSEEAINVISVSVVARAFIGNMHPSEHAPATRNENLLLHNEDNSCSLDPLEEFDGHDSQSTSTDDKPTPLQIDVQSSGISWYKTVPCRFFQFGQCTRGVACEFAHGPLEKREKPNLAKTVLGRRWKNHCCPNTRKECRFAHGNGDLALRCEEVIGSY